MTAITNNNTIRIAVVTGSRADYGLLYMVMKAIADESLFELKIIATGMHLVPEFGNTYKTIENDGFTINAKVDTLLSGDTPSAIAKSIGLGVLGFADALSNLRPDLLLVLGDRYEIFAAVQAAMILKIPVAHIAGGDTTEGAYDEAMRHSITKMSHLHFTTNNVASERVKQLGENPEYVFAVGSPGIDLIAETALLSKQEFADFLGISLHKYLFLITFHPTTLSSADIQSQCNQLLAALDHYSDHCTFLFTKSNSDTYGREINSLIEAYVSQHGNAKVFTSLGQQLYYSALTHADLVIGNSSSGLYEAPSFHTATVNIGDRQKGRLMASSVINCEIEKKSVINAIDQALRLECENTVNPYGDGHASERILAILKQFADKNRLTAMLQKHFYDYHCS